MNDEISENGLKSLRNDKTIEMLQSYNPQHLQPEQDNLQSLQNLQNLQNQDNPLLGASKNSVQSKPLGDQLTGDAFPIPQSPPQNKPLGRTFAPAINQFQCKL